MTMWNHRFLSSAERSSSSLSISSSLSVSAAVFVATMFACWMYTKKEHNDNDNEIDDNHHSRGRPRRKRQARIPRHERFSMRYTDRRRDKGQVGPRGHAALAPPVPYLDQFLTCLNNPCHPEQNPQGHIALCMAENKLVLDLLAERFMQSGPTGFADSSVFTYNSFLGMPIAREAAAYFLARRFLRPQPWDDHGRPRTTILMSPEEALQLVPPKYIGFGAGCAALINNVFFLLGQEGDACLIPKPYYAAFENDMNLIADITPFGIDQANPVEGPTLDELNTAYQQAQKSQLNPKFVLLTNPNNPLGTIYTPDVVRRVIDWARARHMHVIVDEIYALSTHSANPNQHGFQSVLQILDNRLEDNVHMLWAVSKDFGASGLRCGLIYTQNETLMEGLATLSTFTCVSGPIQYLVAEMLTDNVFCDTFLQESRERVVRSYQLCTHKLQEMVLPYIPAQAGLFVYVDFSSLLPERTAARETQLSDILFEHARLVLTPGVSQRDTQRPGMFRICYAWVSPQVLEVAMERLSKLVFRLRRMDAVDWDDPAGMMHNPRAFAGVLETTT